MTGVGTKWGSMSWAFPCPKNGSSGDICVKRVIPFHALLFVYLHSLGDSGELIPPSFGLNYRLQAQMSGATRRHGSSDAAVHMSI